MTKEINNELSIYKTHTHLCKFCTLFLSLFSAFYGTLSSHSLSLLLKAPGNTLGYSFKDEHYELGKGSSVF